MTIDKIAEEFMQKYGISEERTDYLMTAAKLRITMRAPFKYLFQEERRVREAHTLIDRYLSIQQARDNRLTKLSNDRGFHYDRSTRSNL